MTCPACQAACRWYGALMACTRCPWASWHSAGSPSRDTLARAVRGRLRLAPKVPNGHVRTEEAVDA